MEGWQSHIEKNNSSRWFKRNIHWMSQKQLLLSSARFNDWSADCRAAKHVSCALRMKKETRSTWNRFPGKTRCWSNRLRQFFGDLLLGGFCCRPLSCQAWLKCFECLSVFYNPRRPHDVWSKIARLFQWSLLTMRTMDLEQVNMNLI